MTLDHTSELTDPVLPESRLAALPISVVAEIAGALVRSSADYVAIGDRSGNRLCASDGAPSSSPHFALNASTRDVQIGWPAWLDDQVHAAVADARRTKRMVRERLIGVDDTGHHVVDCLVSPILDSHGDLVATVAVGREVGQVASGARSGSIALSASRDGALILDCDRKCAYVNEAAASLLGLDFGDSVGARIDALLASDDTVIRTLDALTEKAEVSQFEMTIPRAAGSPFYAVCRLDPLTGQVATRPHADMQWLLTFQDAADSLQRQIDHERLAAIIESSDDAILSKTLGAIITTWNPGAERIFGYTADEIIGKPKTILFPPDRLQEETTILDSIRAGVRVEHFETVRVRKDGAPINVSLSISPIRDRNGAIVGVSTIARDITARKRAETAIREGEERFQAALEAGELGIWDWNVRDDTVAVSEQAAARFGLDSRQLAGTFETMLCNVFPEDREPLRNAITNALDSRLQFDHAFRAILPAGETRWLHSRGKGIYDDKGQPIRMLGTVADVTEARHLQLRLLQAEKMDGIGRLAAGIAHDYNNLLSVILGYAELAEQSLEPDNAVMESLRNIQDAAVRASQLSAQLLAFARRPGGAARPTDPNRVIGGMGRILNPIVREDIDLQVLLEEDIGAVKIDPTNLEQIVVNLVVNACDAMPAGGVLKIRTRNAPAAEAVVSGDASPREWTHISVSDTGTGMTESVRNRLFEPFFTTKELGRGTGMGLATVYGIVQQSGGHISVDSAEGRGAVVSVYLPHSDESAAVDDLPDWTDAGLGRGEVILVVEDEPLVRHLTVDTLRRHGYRVLEAEDGVDALRVAREFNGAIDLVATDAVMPRMGGIELAQHMIQTRPGTPVLIVTGYLRTRDEDSGAALSLPTLHKPYKAKELLRAVRALLDERLTAAN